MANDRKEALSSAESLIEKFRGTHWTCYYQFDTILPGQTDPILDVYLGVAVERDIPCPDTKAAKISIRDALVSALGKHGIAKAVIFIYVRPNKLDARCLELNGWAHHNGQYYGMRSYTKMAKSFKQLEDFIRRMVAGLEIARGIAFYHEFAVPMDGHFDAITDLKKVEGGGKIIRDFIKTDQ